MKKWLIFLAVLSAALTATAAAWQMDQQTLAGKLIRLHVVANSDSDEDQTIKLRVRDAVLAVTEGLDEKELRQSLPKVETAARNCLREQGCTDPVSVTLQMERFPTRVYETFSLPAGVYETLRVTIGEGAGHNWWCVAFPSICLRATAEDLEAAAASAGFSEAEIEFITGEEGEYVLKFKTLELLDQFKCWLLEKII